VCRQPRPANPQADAADALAIAITHCHVSQNAARMSDSKLNPDYRLFNLTRGVLKHRQIVIDRGDNGRASG
jgi:hypothetical protein